MRALTGIERHIIEEIAKALPEPSRAALFADLLGATVVNADTDDTRLCFELAGYTRPRYQGQHTYGVEGRILDEDGAEVSIILYSDENDRLLELELIRWDGRAIKQLNVDTLKLYH